MTMIRLLSTGLLSVIALIGLTYSMPAEAENWLWKEIRHLHLVFMRN